MAIHRVPEHYATSVSAAGTTQGTATLVTTKHVMVETITAATDRAIVMSEPLAADEGWGTIHNATSEILEVYPPSGYQFNGWTADAYMTIGSYSSVMWVRFDATKIGVIL